MRAAGLLPSRPRTELLDGEIIDRPEEGEPHAWLKIELIFLITRLLDDELRLAAGTTLSLADDEAPEPDLWVFPAGTALRPTPGPAVRLIIEVANSSLSYDLGRKGRQVRRRAAAIWSAPSSPSTLRSRPPGSTACGW